MMRISLFIFTLLFTAHTLYSAEISHDFIPETMRLEAESLLERITVLDNHQNKANLQFLSDTMRLDIEKCTDSPLLLTNFYSDFLAKKITKKQLSSYFKINQDIIYDAYFLYLANLTTTYRLTNMPPLILINDKKINWRVDILRKMLSLEKMGEFYGTLNRDKTRTTYWAMITLKNLLYR